MKNELGPLEITCDAPPYWIVETSREIGMQTPEDVRWTRLSNLIKERARGSVPGHVLSLFWPSSSMGRLTCVCHKELPILEECIFTYPGEGEWTVLLGQCSQCRTIIWESGN
jgi:hypothetical protein